MAVVVRKWRQLYLNNKKKKKIKRKRKSPQACFSPFSPYPNSEGLPMPHLKDVLKMFASHCQLQLAAQHLSREIGNPGVTLCLGNSYITHYIWRDLSKETSPQKHTMLSKVPIQVLQIRDNQEYGRELKNVTDKVPWYISIHTVVEANIDTALFCMCLCCLILPYCLSELLPK